MPRGLELLIAQTILQGFDAQYGRFLEVTSGAQQRFEQADWHAVQQAMKNRIHLYDHHVGLVVEQLRCITNGQSTDAAFLLRVKEHYTRLLPDYPRFEIAESFFNSVYCRLFDHRLSLIHIFGISDQFKIPVKYIGLGEGMEDLQVFRKNEFCYAYIPFSFQPCILCI